MDGIQTLLQILQQFPIIDEARKFLDRLPLEEPAIGAEIHIPVPLLRWTQSSISKDTHFLHDEQMHTLPKEVSRTKACIYCNRMVRHGNDQMARKRHLLMLPPRCKSGPRGAEVCPKSALSLPAPSRTPWRRAAQMREAGYGCIVINVINCDKGSAGFARWLHAAEFFRLS